MPYRSYIRQIKKLCLSKSPSKTQPLALHSIMLALEPRMVFDASLAAGAEALNSEPHAEAPHTTEQTSNEQQETQTERGVDILPFSGEWSQAPQLDFSGGNFTVNEDTLLSIGVNGIRLDDPDSNNFIITISVEHGTLSLDYVAGVVGNQYHFNADRSEVSFEADAQVAQQVLDSLKYQAVKDYNGTDTLHVEVLDGYNTSPESSRFSQTLTINPLADKPEFIDANTLPPAVQAGEDTLTSLVFNHGTTESPVWKPLQLEDADGTTGTYDLVLSVKNGMLSAAGLGSGTLNGETLSYSLNGLSLETINSLLASLQFQSAQDFFGKAELTLSITDTDPALAGNPLVKNFDIDVLAVNDSPNLSPAPQGDRGGQLEVLEVQQDASGNLLGPAEGIFGLEHFNSAYDPFNPSHLPDANGNSALFDVDNNLHQLVVRVDSQPTQGTLWRKIGNDWVKLGAGSTFSLMDVYLGQVKYQHDPALQVRESVVSGSEQDSFAYTVSDGAGGSGSGSVHIALKAVNQLPSVVVKPIPGLVDRLDSTWTADANGSPTENFTIWAYEGEQGIVYAFDVIDPDQAPGADYTLRFTSLPNADYGVFWYSADNGASYQQVTTSTAISLQAVQNGALRFNHSGKESAVGSFNFSIRVTDDGGGEGPLGAKSAEYSLSMNIRPNNDHPEWNSTVNDLWTDNAHTVSVDGTRVITIDNSFLDARDNDSGRDNITYTVRYGYSGSGDSGRLLYHTGQTDGGGQPIYRIIASGEKISQTDVDSGKIHWWFNGEGDKSADLQFIVRDGSISAAPVPTDADQPLPFPWPGTSGESSASAWEHGEGPHEGAIGTWQETSPGSGSYVWTPTVHTLTLVATSIPAGTTPDNPLTIDPIPNFSSSQPVALVPEGKPVALTDQMLHAWFTNGVNGSIIDPQESSGNPANLVYRIEGDAHHGHLVISHDGGASYTALGLYGSFTQQDILDGKIYYQHDGTEAFSDTFAFSVSDGRNEAKNTGNNSYRFSLAFDITPVNDTPYTGKGSDVLVAEHAQPNANAATPGGITTITTDHIRIADVDGTGDKNGHGYATTNELYIVITSLPANGTLYLNGQPVSALTNPVDLATVIQGGGFATWGSEAAMSGVSVISLADIVAGKLTYQHNGTEQFYDNFSYIVSDNQGIDTVQASDHNGSSVNGYEQAVNIVVQPVNDIPEQSHGAPLQLNEGGTATLGPGNITYVDPDGTPAAIQFIVTEIPKYGELTVSGKVLGLGSVFTQQDINEGRVKYTQDGSENHTDTFSYKISDSIYLSPNSENFTCTITQVNDAPLVQAPDTVYVESIAGGIIINGIKITDPDYGPNNKYDGAQDTGVVNDVMTVDLSLSDPNISAIDLAKIDLFFWNGSTFADFSTQRSGNTYTLTGTFSQIQLWLSQVKIQSKTDAGTTYDPNGDIHLDLTVHDGAYNNATNTWESANGSGGSDVYSASDTVKIYISPINNPPTIEHSPPNLSVAEDGPLLSISNGGQGIVIGDVDAFYRGGNSITLSVDHGILLVDPVNGPIITGRGTASLSIEGTRDQINQVLASLKYKADANYNGADSLCYIFKDNANSGEIPAGFNTTAYANHGDQFSYDTGRIDTLNNPIWGLAVYGVVNINVTPVNDAPLIKAPEEIFISSPLLFGGNDGMGNPAHILLADIDITGPGSFVQDSLTLTLSVDNGWLILNNADLVGGVSITGGASLTQTLVLQGSLADLNATLAKLGYSQSNWNASTPTVLNITVVDVANGNQSNGSPDAGSALNATHSMLINCSNLNDAPAISLPGNNWTVNEDDTAAKLFAGGGSITLADPDTFSGQIFVTVSVENGSLSVTRAELAAAGFVLSGNPAAQDAFHITADGKTITFKATLSAINNALKQISYKPTLNYNGEDSVRVYVNDCGLWGDTTGAEEALPSNPLGMTANGLAKTQTGVISIQAINDAPTSSGSADFWGGNGSNLGDFEDSAANETSAKTVGSLFGSLLTDAADNQYSLSNPSGSPADVFAGVVVVGNAASAAQGTWQYSTNNGINWQDIPACSNSNGLYLAADAQLRFVPSAHFNGAPGTLTVHLVDNSASDVAHNNPALPTSGTQVDVSGQNSGNSTRYSSGSVTLAIYIRPVNDAPIASGSTSLASVAEDTVNPSGSTVSALFGLRMDDTLDAVSGGSLANSLGGVVLEGNSATAAQGTWQYSTDNGTSWSTVPANLGDTNGLFLAANAKIRFMPANDFNGTPGSLSARLADNSATDVAHNNPALPASGTLVDVSGTKNGGSTRYSTGLVALGTNVSAVNDAPRLPSGADGQVSLAAVDEDTANPVGNTVSNLFVSSFEDAKDTIPGGSSADNFAGVLITANGATAAQGAWQYHDGTSWKAIPTSFGANQGFAVQANWSLRFVPAADFNGTPGTLSVRLIDDSTAVSGSNPAASFGTMTLVSAVGGATRYSTQVLSLSTNINAVNDAPVTSGNSIDFWGGNGSNLGDFEDSAANETSAKTVGSLFGSMLTDAADNQYSLSNPSGSPADVFAGVVVVGNAASAAQGTWQYSTNNGINWQDIPACSNSNGLYLAADAQLRFVPSAHFNGAPGTLTVHLVDNSASDVAHNNPALPTSGTQVDVSGQNSGNSTRYSSGSVTLATYIRPVNDAPIASGSTSLASVAEDTVNPSGSTVSALFGLSMDDTLDAVSGGSLANSLGGVVLAGNSATAAQGTWQYSTDNGTSWSTVPANLGDANGLFLAANAKIRFVPANDFNGTPGSLSARLADNSATDVAHNNPALPASGTLVDVSGTKNGGSTRYSTGLVALGTNVSAVNDAPRLPSGADGQVSLAAVDEDTANPVGNTVSNLFVSSFEDAKDTIPGGSLADNFAGVLITANGATAAQGAWQYHDGTSWQAIPTSFGANQGFAVQANWSLRFVPAADFNGTPGTLSVRLIDYSTTVSGSNPAASFGTMALVSAVGGETRYSTQVLSLSTNINAVNDAPTVLAGKEQSILNHTEDTISLRTVEDLFGQCFSDPVDAANGGSPNAFAGIVITGNTVSAAQGLWQYYDGTNWVNFSATSTNNGLYLSKDTQMRFVPAADYNGTPGTLTLRLVENGQTHYTRGQILDVSGANSGAETQISLAQVTLSGLVAAVNDAPVANNSTAVTLPAVDEDGTAPGQRVDILFGPRFSDAKDDQPSSTPHTLAGIIIAEVVQNPTKGLWQYSADGGASWTELSANMFVQAGHLIRFEPAADFNGTPGGLSAHLVENSGPYAGSLPASGSLVALTQNGGSSAISSAAVRLQTTINAVNDAPTWNPDVFSPLEAQGGGSFIYIGSMYLDRGNTLSPSNWSTANTIAQHFGTAFTDYTDSVAGGSLANSLHGVWVTGLSGTPQIGEWQYSADGGANWQAISAVSETNALFLQSTALVRFAANPGLSLPMGVLPHVGLEAALADSSDTSPTTGTRADVSGTGRGGTSAVAEHSVPLWLTVIQPNYLPEIHNLPSPNTSATEGQPVVLAPGIQISDMDLDHPSNTMHWNGASVSLARSGGAQRDDVFTAGPGLAPLTEGSALEVGGTVIGTVTRNSAGQLSLSFNSQATNALVNSALQSICYTNTSHNPPTSVALQWSVDDGNYPVNGRLPQGDNPPGERSGKAYTVQQVNITPVNDAPFALDDSANTSSESTQTLYGTVLANDWDYEGPVSVSSSEANLAVYGSLVIHADGNYTYVLHTGHPLLVGLKPGESLVESVNYTIVDAQGLSATATLRITITKPVPPPVFNDSSKPDSKDSLPAFTLKPSEPYGTTHTNNLVTDKPVVREATLFQEALEASTNNSLWFLNQSLLKMQGSLERAGIILSGRMADQVIYSGFNQKVSLPENLFRHSLAGEHLIYSVSLEDGSPLPAWLYWNSRSLSLHASPDYAIKEPLSVKITATDRFNNKAVSVFRIHVNGAAGAVPVPTEVRPDMRQASPIGHAPAARGTHTGGKAMESKAHEPVHPERGIEQPDQELMPPSPASDVPAIENKGQPVSLAPGTLGITGQIALHGQQGLLHKAQESLRSLMGHGA